MVDLPDLRPVPDLLIIEATTYCTNRCRNCPRGENRIGSAHLEFGRFQDLLRELDSIPQPPEAVRFAGFGEPLCWPFLREAIDALSNLGIRSALVTNGQSFDHCSVIDLFNAGLDEMEISVGDVDIEAYEKATGGSGMLRDAAIAEAIRAKPSGQRLNLSVIDSPRAERSLSYYRALVGIDRVFKRRSVHLGPGKYEAECEGIRWPCPQLWQRLTLSVEGKWRYCCSDWQKNTVLPQEGLVDVWQGSEMTHHRLSHEAGDFEAVPVCGDCSIWCTSKWGKGSYYTQTLGEKQG